MSSASLSATGASIRRVASLIAASVSGASVASCFACSRTFGMRSAAGTT